MKKFEKLNKEKFLLEPQKMGELVGGKSTSVCTGGQNSYSNKYGWNSADYTIRYRDEKDHNIVEETYNFWGANDVAARDNKFNTCRCDFFNLNVSPC